MTGMQTQHLVMTSVGAVTVCAGLKHSTENKTSLWAACS